MALRFWEIWERFESWLLAAALLAWLLIGFCGCASQVKAGGDVTPLKPKVGAVNTDTTTTAGRDVVHEGTPWYVSVGMISGAGLYMLLNEGRDWRRRRRNHGLSDLGNRERGRG